MAEVGRRGAAGGEASAASDEVVKVLYVTGFGRSGSTILDNLLGQVSGLFSAGELCYVWDQGLLGGGLCGCGAPILECEVWGKVFGGEPMREVDAREMARLEKAGTRTRHLPLMLVPRGRATVASRLKGYPKNLGTFYREIRRITGARVIVDSSKSPVYGYVLGGIPGVELYVVHLVRDPRAAAYSWLRKKLQPDRGEFGYMDQHTPFKSSLMWTAWNAAAGLLWRRSRGRYLLLRYEDFVAAPRESLSRILNMVGEEDAGLPLVDGEGFELGVNHTVAGNPNRFKTGTVKLRADDEWKERMRFRDRALVTLLTLPGLVRLGYPVFPASRGRS